MTAAMKLVRDGSVSSFEPTAVEWGLLFEPVSEPASQEVLPGESYLVRTSASQSPCHALRLICLSPGWEIVEWRQGWLKEEQLKLPLKSDDFLPTVEKPCELRLSLIYPAIPITLKVRNTTAIPARFEAAMMVRRAVHEETVEELISNVVAERAADAGARAAKHRELRQRMLVAFDIDKNWRVEGDYLYLHVPSLHVPDLDPVPVPVPVPVHVSQVEVVAPDRWFKKLVAKFKRSSPQSLPVVSKPVLRKQRPQFTTCTASLTPGNPLRITSIETQSKGWQFDALFCGSDSLMANVPGAGSGLKSEFLTRELPLVWASMYPAIGFTMRLCQNSESTEPLDVKFGFELFDIFD